MVIYYLAWVCNSGMEWTLKLNNLFLWWMQLKSLLKPFCTNTLTETDIDILAFTWSKLILLIASTWYCSCDWTVNSAATTIEIEVAYSSHSYWYCNCDCIVNTAAMLPKLKLHIACTATDIVVVIEHCMLPLLLLKLRSNLQCLRNWSWNWYRLPSFDTIVIAAEVELRVKKYRNRIER